MALYYSHQAIYSWKEAPIVASVETMEIAAIDFPAVSVCHPVSWTWPSIFRLFDQLDVDGSIVATSILSNKQDFLEKVKSQRQLPDFDAGWKSKCYNNPILCFTSPNVSKNIQEGIALSHFLSFFEKTFKDAWKIEMIDVVYLVALAKSLPNYSNAMGLLSKFLAGKGNLETIIDDWMEATYEFSINTENLTFAEFTCLSRFNESQLANDSVSTWCNTCLNPIDKFCIPNWYTLRIVFNDAFPFSSETWTKRKLIDLAFGQVLAKKYGSYDSPDPMPAYFEMMRKQESKIDPFYLWESLSGDDFLNEDFLLLSNQTNPNRKTNLNDLNMDFVNQNDLGNLLQNPEVHGNGDFGNEHVLIPLCSFGSDKLQVCNLFKKVEHFYQKDQVCYTFDKSSSNSNDENSVKPFTGLNLVINFRLPRDSELEPVKVIIHPKGVMPDGNSYPSSVHDIRPSIVSKIGVTDITITNVTKNFQSMNDDLKNCFLEKGYHQVNCRMTERLDMAAKYCGCLPWFISSKNETICMKESLTCFHTTMKNLTNKQLKQQCPKACISTQYSITFEDTLIDKKAEYLKLARSFGENWKNYILDETSALFYADYENTLTFGNEVKLMKRTSLVHVNFIKPEATLITKDAKVTFADQLGNIGGTFGVFLGLSFVGILDFAIVCFQWMYEQFSLSQ